MEKLKIFIFLIIIGIISGILSSFTILYFYEPSKNKLIKEYYAIENAVKVSPHGLRLKMAKGDNSFILVDLRSREEYEKEHIAGAINIPAYADKDTPDYGAVERIVSSFDTLPKDKDIIVYCYSTPCMTGKKVGKILADNGIYVKHLGIGWNEWRYGWTLWNHEHEWELTDVKDYIVSGYSPGEVKIVNKTGCYIDSGTIGC